MTRITFPGAHGATLAARLDRPDGPHQATALFAHCFSCGKDIAAARRIAGRLTSAGYAVLRFDFTGLGHSEGEFANTTFTSNVGDLHAAADWLSSEGMPPALLVGHSLGGAAVLRAAAGIDSVRAVATIGAPFDPAHVTHNFHEHLDEIERHGAAEVSLGGRAFTIGRDFVQDVRETALAPAIRDLDRALLVMHAPRDAVVGIENATRIFTAARHPRSFVTLDDADHLLSRAEDAHYAAEVIGAWAARYIDRAPEPARPDAPEGVARSLEADPAGFLQDVTVGDTHMLADEPAAMGGTDRGPSPYGFVSAGLAACTSMTIRMYARRKGWPLAHVRVDVTHDKVHREDCEGCAENGGKIDRFRREIHLRGDLTDDQRDRLIAIADKCPVHRTLSARSEIVTTAAAPA